MKKFIIRENKDSGRDPEIIYEVWELAKFLWLFNYYRRVKIYHHHCDIDYHYQYSYTLEKAKEDVDDLRNGTFVRDITRYETIRTIDY